MKGWVTGTCLLLSLALALALRTGAQGTAPGTTQGRWVSAWSTALASRTAPVGLASNRRAGANALFLQGQTIRQFVRPTLGGEQVRLVLSNAFGTRPIIVGAANIALRLRQARLVPGTSHPVTFAGQPTTAIPPGGSIVSDPVAMRVESLTDLGIDLYLPDDLAAARSPVTLHVLASQTHYVSARGNHAGAAVFPVAAAPGSWLLLSRLEVLRRDEAAAVVAFGDSIADGTRSTVNGHRRWPDELARRLQARPSARALAVLNAGLAGNRLLAHAYPELGERALDRFDRDVLGQPGAAHVIVFEGINDILMTRGPEAPMATALIGAYRQLIARGHAAGLKVHGGTLTPFGGSGPFFAEGEKTRQKVNDWIRSANEFDSIIDFDAVVRDPAAPTRILPAFDSGDHLHPNDAGYTAMGRSIDIDALR